MVVTLLITLTRRRAAGNSWYIRRSRSQASGPAPAGYLNDQIFTYLTAMPTGELSEFSGGPPIVCST